jgi:DNA-binding transcriptional regulator YdaS (Cro superfamily)
LTEAIALLGVSKVGQACGVSHQAVRKWEAAGRFPASEHAGKTAYALAISRATQGGVKVTSLREWSRAGWGAKAD